MGGVGAGVELKLPVFWRVPLDVEATAGKVQLFSPFALWAQQISFALDGSFTIASNIFHIEVEL